MLKSLFKDLPSLPILSSRSWGRTGLSSTLLGFGTGGKSRFGATQGLSETGQIRVLRCARECGINYFDTSPLYGNEHLLSRAFSADEREKIIISTKFIIKENEATDVRSCLEASLRQIGQDHVDIYLAHAVAPGSYPRLTDDLVPELQRLKQEGKVRFIGISERFESDPSHSMLASALADNWWDIAMVGYSLLNPSAADRILVPAAEQGRGLIGMFAVRTALSQAKALETLIHNQIQLGRLGPEWSRTPNPLLKLLREYGIGSTMELGYRFTAHHPLLSSTLIGTSNIRHLEANIHSTAKGPLPRELLAQLDAWFGPWDHLSGS